MSAEMIERSSDEKSNRDYNGGRNRANITNYG